jgi:5-methylcytosine-specific restriction endonuclease McrA
MDSDIDLKQVSKEAKLISLNARDYFKAINRDGRDAYYRSSLGDNYTTEVYKTLDSIAKRYNDFVKENIDFLVDTINEVKFLPKKVAIPFIVNPIRGECIMKEDAEKGLNFIVKECERTYKIIDNRLTKYNVYKTKSNVKNVYKRQPISQAQRDIILSKQNNLCASCGIKFNERIHPNFDHIKLVSQNGKSTTDNIQALCANCHDDKTRRERAKASDLKKSK